MALVACALGSAAVVLVQSGCYSVMSSDGAGQVEAAIATRSVDAGDIVVPEGFAIAAVAQGLTYPTGVTFEPDGTPVVVEAGYSYGEDFTVPRLLAVGEDGRLEERARGDRGGPWTGVSYHEGAYYVAAGNVRDGGAILRIDRRGVVDVLVDELPSLGDHHTNGPVVGPDGWIYFAQGTATNSGVVGPDNAKFGWLRRYPEFHDTTPRDLVLAGENRASADVLAADPGTRVVTGPFLPFGTAAAPGQVVRGQEKAGGTIYRVSPAGGPLELVAWGLRNPFGLAFAPDGRLFATENGYDDRGSRPVWGAPDVLWQIEPGAWYGWPDYVAGLPITHPAFRPPGGPELRFVLREHPGTPPQPRARFAVHASANGFDFSSSETFGYTGEAFVALFGDQAPTVGKVLAPVGCKVVRVDPATGVIADFAVNQGPTSGPASKVGGGGLERPIAARFSPDGRALYVVDFGILRETPEGSVPVRGTGVLWRITRVGEAGP